MPESVRAGTHDKFLRDAASRVSVIGHVTGNLGLGVLTRNVIGSLQSRGATVIALDIDPGGGRAKHDKTYAHLCVRQSSDIPSGITIWVLTPETLGGLALREQELYLRPELLHVALPMWELPALPRHLTTCMELFDIIVAQSDFIDYVMNAHVSSVRTIAAPHHLDIPDDVKPNRRRFGLPDDGVVFACAFDPNSDVARKNPTAVLRAFANALGGAPNAHLVVKVNSKGMPDTLAAEHGRLLTHAAAHPRISVITDVLSYRETLSLYASCDVYVSMHRAEGLGLGLMEAMALGKPVIATAWSGNMSFMSDSNSCLVGYRLVPVQGNVSSYRKNIRGINAVWADPDLDEASAWMRRLYEEPALRSRIGARAIRDSAAYRTESAKCTFLDTISTISDNWHLSGTDVRLFADRRRRLEACRLALHPPLPNGLRQARDVYDRYVGWRFKSHQTL